MSGIRRPTFFRRGAAVVGRLLGYPSFIRVSDFWYDEEHGGGRLREFIERLGQENLPKRAIYTQIRRRERRLKKLLKSGGGLGIHRLPADVQGSELVRCVSVKLQYGAFLYELVRHLDPEGVVEIGTAFGISGMYLGYGLEGNRAGHLYTFDPHPVLQPMGAESLRLATQRATATLARFEAAWVEVADKQNVRVDLAYVDGPHTYTEVMTEYRMLKTRAGREAVFVFDDIRWSEEMVRAWNELKSGPQVICRAEIAGRYGVIQIDSQRG